MIGDLIKIFRKERGVGVLELAQTLGISRISLFRIEKGQRQPSEKTAIRAFKALGLSEEHIYAIFVFNEMLRWKVFASKKKKDEAQTLLQRLDGKDKNSTILHRYFQRILTHHHGSTKKRT